MVRHTMNDGRDETTETERTSPSETRWRIARLASASSFPNDDRLPDYEVHQAATRCVADTLRRLVGVER